MAEGELAFLALGFQARAIYTGERLDLRAIEASSRLAVAPTVVRAGAAGVAVLFRYGAIVLYNVAPLKELAFREQLKPFVVSPVEQGETEETLVHVRAEQEERPVDNTVSMKAVTLAHLQCLADALAKSVVLGHTEASMARVFDGIEPLSKELEEHGTIRQRSRSSCSTLAVRSKCKLKWLRASRSWKSPSSSGTTLSSSSSTRGLRTNMSCASGTTQSSASCN